MKKIILFSLLLFISSSSWGQQEKFSKLRIYFDGRPVQDLLQLGVTCDHGQHKPAVHFESDFSESDVRLLQEHGFRYEVLIEDVVAYYQEQNAVGQHAAAIVVAGPMPLLIHSLRILLWAAWAAF